MADETKSGSTKRPVLIVGGLLGGAGLIYLLYLVARLTLLPFLGTDEILVVIEHHSQRPGYVGQSLGLSAERPFELVIEDTTTNPATPVVHVTSHRQFLGYSAYLRVMMIRDGEMFSFFDTSSGTDSPPQIGKHTFSSGTLQLISTGTGPQNVKRLEWPIASSGNGALRLQVRFTK